MRSVRSSGNHAREELILHLAGDFDFRFQALLLLGDDQQLLQMLGHAVEGLAEFGQLIVAGDLDAMREIACDHQLRAFIEAMHRAGDGARDADSDHHGDNLDDDENDRSRRSAETCPEALCARSLRLKISASTG